MKRIVVGFDGSPSGQRALDRAIELAKGFAVPLTVLTVADHHLVRQDGVVTPAADEALAERIAAQGAEQARELGLQDVETRTALGDAAEALAAAVPDAETWLIIGHRGLGGLQELFLGSVAKSVVDLAHGSVLVVR
jgi:nucleotide-binding universal stress UspA family protein